MRHAVLWDFKALPDELQLLNSVNQIDKRSILVSVVGWTG